MPNVLLLGDSGSHDGQIITSAMNTTAEGKLIVRVGDMYRCGNPYHGVNAIVTPMTIKTYVEGKLVAVDGARTSCGSVLSSSAIKTNIE